MVHAIISLVLRWRGAVLIAVVVVAGIGLWSLLHLPIDAVPDITNNQVQVITVAPALSAPDIERLITFPIEQACANIPGLIELRSFSRFGLSVITLVFDDDVDTYWARQQINEQLSSVRLQLPPGTGTPELAPVTTGLGEILQYVIRPKPGYENQYSLQDLRTIQDWIVRRQLLGTRGVADVASFGGLLKQYVIVIDPERLSSLGISIIDIARVVEENSTNAGGAYIEKGPNVEFIRTEGFISSLKDLKAISVTTRAGVPISLGEISTIRVGSAIRFGAMTYNGEREVAGAVIMMLKGENSSAVVQRVKERLAQIEQTLPEGIIIEPFLDRTKMVRSTIATVRTNLFEGAAIVIVVLLLLLGNIPAALIVASVIPLSFLIAAVCMQFFGVSGNLMSLGALDFGLLVDGAVIIVEAVAHRLIVRPDQQAISPSSIIPVVQHEASRLMRAALFGQLIILIVYVPILLLEGIEGKMFRPMAQVLLFALGAAFILSMTYIPAVTTFVFVHRTPKAFVVSERIITSLQRFYTPVLIWALRNPVLTISLSCILFGGALLAAARLGGEFIPKLEEGDFAVDTRLLTGSSLTATVHTTARCARMLRDSFPEVTSVVTKIGSAEIPTDPMPLEASDMMVILKPKNQWVSAASFDELAELMQQLLEKHFPGITFGFQFPVQMRFNELMTGARQDVVCKIFGDNLDTLTAYAERMEKLVQTIPGTTDVYRERMLGMPQLVVRYDREALGKYGITIEQANGTIAAAFAGVRVGTYYDAERRFDIVVRLDSSLRNDPTALHDLPLRAFDGAIVPLRMVATITSVDGPNQIQREAARRRITIGFNVRRRDVESVVNELQQRITQSLHLAPGYSIVYGGTFEHLQQARTRLAITVPIALISIAVLLYAAFRTLRHTALIMSIVPLSAIGGIFALLVRGIPFSVSAGVGFIALFGVAVLNGVVLVTEFNRRRKRLNLLRAVISAVHVRFRPVLLTATVASLGFLPMALSQSAGAEVQRPLATVVIGGLISATLLTLVVLPVLYVVIEQRKVSLASMSVGALSFCLLLITDAHAQPIALERALQLLENAHPERKFWSALEHHAEIVSGSWLQLAPVQATLEYGQYNTPTINDTRFSLQVPLELPSVHAARKKRLVNQYLHVYWGNRWNQAQRRADLTRLYYGIRIARRIYAIMHQADSLLAEAVQIAERQVQQGYLSPVHRATVSLARGQIHSEHLSAEAKLRSLEQVFNRMLASNSLTAEDGSLTLDTVPLPMHTSPFLEQTQAFVQQRYAERDALYAQLLPTLVVGYTRTTLIGSYDVGGREITVDRSSSFGSFQLSLAIHLPTPWFLTQLHAADQSMSVALWEYRRAQWELEALYQDALQRLNAARHLRELYERQLLPAAEVILRTSTGQLHHGTISHIEWLMSVQQALAIQRGWLDVLSQYNDAFVDVQLYQPQR